MHSGDLEPPLLDDADHHRLRLELFDLPYRPLTPPTHDHIVLRGMRLLTVAD